MVARTLLVRGVSLIGLVFCAALPGTAQESRSGGIRDIAFQRLDGLSHNTVLSIVQDERGFLWIGTSDGLNRYDGYEFTVYRHHPADTTSLSSNVIKSLLEDRFGNLWVGTDGGLDRFDRRSGAFVRYFLQPPRPTAKQTRDAILDLLEDDKGHLWVATRGLYRYDLQADRFTAFRHDPGDPNSLSSDHIWSLFEGLDQTLWVTTGDGVLHRYDTETDHFLRYPLPQRWNHPTLVYEDEAGRLWLSDLDGSAAFDRVRDRFTTLPDGLPDRPLVNTLEDRRGTRWLGATDGLYRYDRAKGAYIRVPVDPSQGTYLQNSVKVLFEDRAGILWVGTLGGLYRLDPHLKPFRHLGHDPKEANSLTSGTVMAVSETADGMLWVGTLGGGLNRYDREAGTIVRYRHRNGSSSSLCSDLIWSRYEDRRGTLWIGTDEGLCAMNRRTGRFTRYELPLGPGETRQPPINAIRDDEVGRLWVATNTGLYRLDPTTGDAARYVPMSEGQDAPPIAFSQSLHVDRDGILWIGTFFGRLYSFDPGAEIFTHHPLSLSEDKELVSEGIWAIHEGADGIFWLGSDFGLTRYDLQTGAVKHLAQSDGLPGSIVYAILEDDSRRLWLSTNHGLALFDERLSQGQRIQIFDAGDGLRNSEFNRRAALKGADGTFYFGGLKGLTWFHPAEIRNNQVVPPVELTRIETSNRDTTVSINPFGLEEMVLSYRDYTISFEFAALNFTNPSRNRYRYRMEGFDDGWIDAGTRRFARYTNLPVGDYVFRVLGSNNDGYWNEEGAALPLTVTPPYWQTWWFRLGIAAIVIGLLTVAYRLRMARVVAMERMRLRIASDLHDDIGSNLSSIALLSDMVRDKNRLGKREQRHLATISDSARKMVDALRDIVWSIDPDKDRTADLVDRMRDTAASLLTSVKHSFRTPDAGITGSLDMDTRRHILLMYKEIVHNIVRHANATEVITEVDETDGMLTVRVSDDGEGFEAIADRGGTGLKYLSERAAEIKAELVIESAPGSGTTVLLNVPIRHSNVRSIGKGQKTA